MTSHTSPAPGRGVVRREMGRQMGNYGDAVGCEDRGVRHRGQ